MELLILLVRRRDQLVSRADIVAHLWRSNLFVDVELNINNIVYEKSVRLWVTTQIVRALSKQWWAKGTDLSDACA